MNAGDVHCTNNSIETIKNTLKHGGSEPKPQDRKHAKDEWTMFKRLFNDYAVVTRLNQQEKPYQLAGLLNVMGPTGVRLYDSPTFTDNEDKADTDVIITKIDAVIQYELNEAYERYFFNKRNQGTTESFDSYLAEIRNLAKSCNC